MEKDNVFNKLLNYTRKMLELEDNSFSSTEIVLQSLCSEEAIGNPGRQDFPLQKGKEKLVETRFRGCPGQAFTDMPGNMQGTLKNFIGKIPENNFQRAAFIAVLNAVMRYKGIISGTVHCKDTGPAECSKKLAGEIAERFGRPNIAVIGLQPAMVETLAPRFPLRVFDLDPDNVGKEKFGVIIENGEEIDLDEIQEWCSLFLATGSMVVNGTISPYLNLKKPVIFYGNSIAGAAEILGVERFCPFAS